MINVITRVSASNSHKPYKYIFYKNDKKLNSGNLLVLHHDVRNVGATGWEAILDALFVSGFS
ncbi:MAG: hypothetical protein HEQ35_13555 [Gloeotrichia echinulata IR180]